MGSQFVSDDSAFFLPIQQRQPQSQKHNTARLRANTRSLAKSTHISVWSEEAAKGCVDLRSGTSSNSRVILLRSSLHDTKLVDTEFLLPQQHLHSSGGLIKIPSSTFGEVCYHTGYWEWIEYILEYHANILRQARIYAAVHASLFTYVCNKNVLQAFLELWCPSTNTLHTKIGELSISLGDMHGLGGLPLRGDFHDEVVPTAKQLLGDGKHNSSLSRSCKYLFLAYHQLPKTSGGILISDWINF
ncbi:hypothetical protein BUALT_Bualt18G0010500 [Buddleja alternifolia]|uniref:Aminotransferase-like plant mobile domain-containing protein n=1 Tax=Buddleja alternifolia TaxID=168488 RepID=A0AAV6WA55_9LAMI|nr:hypothetical protein BUALT_Bualt18G0010500 [Buddleja alternifolia]